MSVVENEIQKLKSFLDQAAKGLQSIDPQATGGFEINSIKNRIEKMQADLRQKESKMGAEKGKDSIADLNKLESKQKNLELDKKKYEEEIRTVADNSVKQVGQLQSQINKLEKDLQSAKGEEARLRARIQGAKAALQQAQKELPKVAVAIEKAEREAQEKSRKRLDEKANKEMKQRFEREKKLEAEADKRLREIEAARKKQEEEIKKQRAAAAEKDKPDSISEKEAGSEAKKILKRKQRAEKRLRALQDAAHKKDPDSVRRERLLKLKGLAQRGGMSSEQKEEYDRLKSKDIKSKAK
jgi:chromosome segregation ATPase